MVVLGLVSTEFLSQNTFSLVRLVHAKDENNRYVLLPTVAYFPREEDGIPLKPGNISPVKLAIAVGEITENNGKRVFQVSRYKFITPKDLIDENSKLVKKLGIRHEVHENISLKRLLEILLETYKTPRNMATAPVVLNDNGYVVGLGVVLMALKELGVDPDKLSYTLYLFREMYFGLIIIDDLDKDTVSKIINKITEKPVTEYLTAMDEFIQLVASIRAELEAEEEQEQELDIGDLF